MLLNLFSKRYYLQLSYFLKKKITEFYPIKSNIKNILIFEPLFDLFYSPYKVSNTLFHKELKFNNSENFVIKKKENEYLKSYLINLLNQNTAYLSKSVNKIKEIIKKYKIKRILIGCDPNPILSNILNNLSNSKIEVIGCQHGGGYITQNYDREHIDSDYNFCDYFLSYGYSKQVENKIKKKIVDLGSFKSKFFNQLDLDKHNKVSESDILFIPNEITPIISPTTEIIQNKRYELQKKICKNLNEIESKVTVKALNNLDYFPIIKFIQKNYNYFNIEYCTIGQAIKKVKPKLIILDYLGSTLFEPLYSQTNVILFLDKYNMPKKDFLNQLNKNVIIINDIKKLKKILKSYKSFKIPNYKKIIDVYYNLGTDRKNKNRISKIFNG
tara:strand:- start:97 stop:1248 length:1152 start_codon:yes stop_codon:yes gene_type:complete